MERLGLFVFVALSLMCISTVECSDMDIGRMIQWVDAKVGWLISARKFQNYGCYCSKNGPTDGIVPVDQIDKCCMKHNQCYDGLVREGVCAGDTFGQSYGYKKITENGAKTMTCTSDPHTETCKYELCKCDATVAHCFADNEPHYNSKHKGVGKSSCQHAGK
ncbi:phospholipase A2 AP-PLA2-II [Strongylocentrotus purpuratus]|uniref:Phospholipase A2 n=1 Tax=Strongylocentrotus purpuratus TaxID=7668 RepID=A0A7M7RBP5_STRPU|nr:phospholipase A2 AP-PLA2-II [Strongylocentrotus purpuratus]XP_801926.1 phospholipase A2 AP-PLA2-II [Strongylocentrotus purpuratus]|eukprot:XP_003725547.1 PREDICTED: phospholipase A2 AP-PLA2-II [Strongylocentrotus purpuratus]